MMTGVMSWWVIWLNDANASWYPDVWRCASGVGNGRCGWSPRPPVLLKNARGLRRAARALRLAELRDGVWLRPDNVTLTGDAANSARSVMAAQASRFVAFPDADGDLVERLWDQQGWNHAALSLRREMAGMAQRLSADDLGALQPGFVLAAAVLRHMNADPLLPVELRAMAGRSGDQVGALRRDYESYNETYSALLRRWLAAS